MLSSTNLYQTLNWLSFIIPISDNKIKHIYLFHKLKESFGTLINITSLKWFITISRIIFWIKNLFFIYPSSNVVCTIQYFYSLKYLCIYNLHIIIGRKYRFNFNLYTSTVLYGVLLEVLCHYSYWRKHFEYAYKFKVICIVLHHYKYVTESNGRKHLSQNSHSK